MGIWDILGIEATTDEIKIKKAYAEASKKCHPEEHPEEFKRLKNAYKTALFFAMYGGKAEPDVPEAEPENDFFSPQSSAGADSDFDFGEVFDAGDDRSESDKLKEAFWNEFNLIIWHPYLRNNVKVWEYILTESAYCDLFIESGFREEFFLRISSEKGIWHIRTVRYIDRRIKDLFREKSIYDTTRSYWLEMLTYHPGRDILAFKRFCTREEKDFYREIWKSENENNIMKKGGRLAEYIQSFSWYAASNKEKFESIYKRSLEARRRQMYFAYGFAAAFTAAIFFITGYIEFNPPDSTVKKNFETAYTRLYEDYHIHYEPDEEQREGIEAELKKIMEKYNN